MSRRDVNLPPVPAGLGETRSSLHQIAFFALGPARYKAVGRMGLVSTPGGFGTPEFDGRVARVEVDLLVHEEGGQTATQTIGTIREASRFFGNEYEAEWFDGFHDPLHPADPDTPLVVDPEASKFLGNWFEFGWELLGRLRDLAVDGDAVSEIQLWPEHFDAAVEMGDSERNQRATYGVSPGDLRQGEPYLYVVAWSDVDRGNRYWNDRDFNGASLRCRQLAEAGDPRERALDFLLEGRRILGAG